MRLLVGVVVGLAVGFLAGWLTFEQPWGSDEMTGKDVAVEVLQQVPGDNESATCDRRQYPANVYDCEVLPSSRLFTFRFRVTVDPDSSVRLGKREVGP